MTTTDSIDYSTLHFYQWDTMAASERVAPQINYGIPLDSIFRVHEANDSLCRPSFLAPHSLVQQHDILVPRTITSQPVWLFVALAVLVALTCLYYRRHNLTIGNLATALFDRHAMSRTLRDSNLVRIMSLVPTAVLMSVTAAFAVRHVAFGTMGIVSFLALAAGTVAAYTLRNGLMRMLGGVFENKEAVAIYITSNYVYHLALTTLLLPLLLLMVYMPVGNNVVAIAIGAIVAIEFIIRLLRGMKLFLTQSNGFNFYLFCYLCIIEIAPIIVAAKFVIK